MRTREKLTLEEKFSLALELIKRERNLDEIQSHYRVSHTTAYKIRNAFLEGGRAALSGERKARPGQDLEARVSAIEARLGHVDGDGGHKPLGRPKGPPTVAGNGDDFMQARRMGK